MQVTLIFMAIIMACVIGWLLKQSLNMQPWVSDEVADASTVRRWTSIPRRWRWPRSLRSRCRCLPCSASAYTLRMEEPDWIPVKDPDLLWINTGFLVLASIAYHWTRNQVVDDRGGNLMGGLIAAGVMSFLFLFGQIATWQQLQDAGYYMSTNPANAFFLPADGRARSAPAGRSVRVGRSVMKVRAGATGDAVRLSVELCTIYWHFLLLVWVVLFGLLLST